MNVFLLDMTKKILNDPKLLLLCGNLRQHMSHESSLSKELEVLLQL